MLHFNCLTDFAAVTDYPLQLKLSHMWADNETSEDLLGFKVHADLLVDVIRDETVLPVTIGVFGDWGSGKSSILKIMYNELAAEDKDELKDETLVIYLNGWVFEGYDDAKAALMETIIEHFEKHKRFGSIVKEKAKKLIKSVRWMRVLGLGFKKVIVPGALAYFTGGASLLPMLLDKFKSFKPEELASKLTGEGAGEFLKSLVKKPEEEDETTLIREFRDDFDDMLKESKIRKLVVIIDDLDRCTPERIIENLEAIKLFLNVQKTAFVIGADPRIVRHAIEHRYKTDDIENSTDPNSRNKRIVSDYLEKLIQVPYNLPRLSDNEVETYLTLLFCKHELGNKFDAVHKAFCEHREKDRYSVFGLGNLQNILSMAQKEKLGSTVSLIASLSGIVTEGLNGNPRQIKRFLNTFTLRRKLVSVEKFSDFKIDVLAKLMVLEYAHPELFRRIYKWQALQQGEPKEIIEIEGLAKDEKVKELLKTKSYTDWTSDRVLQWLKVEPQLSGIDLRNYYWISRDQLMGSISGTSLVPEHIRDMFKRLAEYGSAKILETAVKEVAAMSESEQGGVLNLLEKELIRTPDKEPLHQVMIEMMKQLVPGSIASYQRVIGLVNHTSIPSAINNEMKTAAKKNTAIEGLYSLFTPASRISRALLKTD